MVRVLVLSNLYPPDVIGGYEIACADVVGELERRGHDVRVLTSTPRLPIDNGSAIRTLQFVDVYDSHIAAHRDAHTNRLAVARATVVNSHNIQLLRQALEAFRPDVVYLWNLVGIGGLGLALTVDLCGYPWVWHLQDASIRDLTVSFGTRQREVAAVVGRRMRGTWISVSQGLLDETAATGATLGDQVVILPNGVTGKRPPPRPSWFHPGQPLRAAFFGRLASDKGADLAIKAVLLAASPLRPIVLEVFGAGPERGHLEALARTAGDGAEIRFQGRVPQADMLRSLEEQDVMIFPTAPREPFGLVTIEAASRGCVPLVTRASGISQWLMEGKDFMGIERTPESIAAALDAIASGEVDLGAIGSHSQETIWTKFRLDRIVPHIENVLAGAIARHPQRAPMASAEVERLGLVADRLAEVVIGTL